MTQTLLKIDASARTEGSVTRAMTQDIVDTLAPSSVISRDLARQPLPQINEAWVDANFTPADARTPEQQEALALSDQLVAELQAADTIVLGAPIYNFGVPAALKAWIDQVARAGVTFKYTEKGPVGLLEGKKAIVVIASGGVAARSAVDFTTPYMEHVLGFLGITDVSVIAADALGQDAEAKRATAQAEIAALAA